MTPVGLHDSGGIGWMMANGVKGVALDHVSVGSEPIPLDYSKARAAGIDVIVRLNYGYADGTGTLPPTSKLPAFERAVVATMKQSKGVAYFHYGNEVNNPAEWPAGEALTAQGYVESYNRVWWATPFAVKMGPAPLDPYFGPGSNNRDWWTTILGGIGGADALFLHSKTQTNDPNEIASDAKFSDDPLKWQYLHFRTFETSLAAVPSRFKDRPAFITEANPQRLNDRHMGWLPSNSEWICRCREYVNQWNDEPMHQAVRGIVFYRWADDDWAMYNKPRLLAAVRG